MVFSRFSLDEAPDRAETKMRSWYLPAAHGVLIAGPLILSWIGYTATGPDPVGWMYDASGWWKLARDGKTILWVQHCDPFWTVERARYEGGEVLSEALVYGFGPCPIWA